MHSLALPLVCAPTRRGLGCAAEAIAHAAGGVKAAAAAAYNIVSARSCAAGLIAQKAPNARCCPCAWA